MVAVMLPFMLAMYQRHGQPLEVILKQVYEVKFVKPRLDFIRFKISILLENQYDYEKEFTPCLQEESEKIMKQQIFPLQM